MTGDLHLEPDKQLLQLVAAGDEAAFAALFSAHRNRICSLAYKLTGVLKI